MPDAAQPESINPKSAYVQWLAEGEVTEPRKLDPIEELVAEHYLVKAMLLAMEKEAQWLIRGGPLRPEFWNAMLEFNGDFVHRCHRQKEEKCLAPLLLKQQLLETKPVADIRLEHFRAAELTFAIRNGFDEGDWEKVHRLVLLYVHHLRPHIIKEEDQLFVTARNALSDEAIAILRAEFDQVDENELNGKGRSYYARAIARSCDVSGIEYDLDPGAG